MRLKQVEAIFLPSPESDAPRSMAGRNLIRFMTSNDIGVLR